MINEVVETKTGKAVIFYNLPAKEINGEKYYYMKFLSTGYGMFVNPKFANIAEDPYYPKFFGVGYLGECGSLKGLEKIYGNGTGTIIDSEKRIFVREGELVNATGRGIFSKWLYLLARCYNPKFKGYKKYMFVDPRWHSFYNFAMDLQRISGFKSISFNFITDDVNGRGPNLKYQLGHLFNPCLNKYVISPYSTMWINDQYDMEILRTGYRKIKKNTCIYNKYLGRYRQEQPKNIYDLIRPRQSDIDSIVTENFDNKICLEREINNYRFYIQSLETNHSNQIITDTHKDKYGFFIHKDKKINYKLTKKLEKEIITDLNNELLFKLI